MRHKLPVYLDYNATTPIAPAVIEAMRPYLETHFGNPSSAHVYGQRARMAVSAARASLAALLGCAPEEIVFTSGGSESNNFAIRGAVEALAARGDHLITSAVEHPAVSEVCASLARQGLRVTVLPVDEFGMVSPAALEAEITDRTVLVSVMHANNEVGTIQPIAELSEIAHRHGALLHTDAAQSTGKIPVRVDELGADLLSVAGHKLYAPKGVGALYIRRGVEIARLIHGADHERNLRAGTENVLEIVGLGRAAELAADELVPAAREMQRMRDRLQAALESGGLSFRLNGHPTERLPNTLSVSFPQVEANTLLDELADEVAASAGAACHTDSVDVSAVLEAMGVPVEVAMGTVRFSTGRPTTADEIDRAAEAVAAAVRRLQPGAAGDVPPRTAPRTAAETPPRPAAGEVLRASPGRERLASPDAQGDEGLVAEQGVDRDLRGPFARQPGVIRGLEGEDAPVRQGTAAQETDGVPVRLTRFTHGLGCACKLRPQDLEQVLQKLPRPSDARALVGIETADDAAVFLLSDDLAIVQTVDFFTPVVDDPYLFGAIAAANSLSDIYAMGAEPLFGLSIVGFPDKRLGLDVLGRILRGAADKAAEAGIAILGGHSVEDSEPKYGLAVTGRVHPERVLRNTGARPGDALVLTKPLGTGIIATGAKRGVAGPDAVARASELMAALNRQAAEALAGLEVHACTDVTGFGLLGHLKEMSQGSGVDVEIELGQVPVIAGARELAQADVVPGGTRNNLAFVEAVVDFDPAVSVVDRLLLADAQTSGGLLIAPAEQDAAELTGRLEARGVLAARIGRFVAEGTGRIRVRASPEASALRLLQD